MARLFRITVWGTVFGFKRDDVVISAGVGRAIIRSIVLETHVRYNRVARVVRHMLGSGHDWS